jgi:tRNA-intron endonuclease
VIIPDYDCANRVYWNGYYGTFLGVQKPKSKGINAPLELSLIEALYLLEKNAIRITAGDTPLTPSKLHERARQLVERFDELYAIRTN